MLDCCHRDRRSHSSNSTSRKQSDTPARSSCCPLKIYTALSCAPLRHFRLHDHGRQDIDHARREAALLNPNADVPSHEWSFLDALVHDCFPAATAGATFLLENTTGAFHGMIIATTPYGRRRNMLRNSFVFRLMWPCPHAASAK